jgi:hypothetical protein
VALLLAALLATFCRAEEPKQDQPEGKREAEFLRVTTDDAGELMALETAIVSYVPADGKHGGLVVDLIGAVHVGEKSYYEKLNESFKQYEVLLYELVAAKGDVPRAGVKRDSKIDGGGAIMGLQSGMKSMLELEHQLEVIDYTAKNFVHADMSPREFNRSMKDRDESFLKMFFRMMGAGMAMQASNPDAPKDHEVLAAMFSRNRALDLKRLLARQFEGAGGQLAALEGPDGSTLITERNKKALEVLKSEIDSGKKRIGIFYGAGHLDDMEERLLADFGLKRDREQWLEAWDLRSKDVEKKEPKGKSALQAVFDALTK